MYGLTPPWTWLGKTNPAPPSLKAAGKESTLPFGHMPVIITKSS